MIIIGIDPGSHRTGYGLLQIQKNQPSYLASGCIQTKADNPFARLQQIYEKLQAVVELYHPEEAAIEQIFMHQNPNSALKLGQARGVAIAALLSIPIAEYSARRVKQSVVGFGAATKEQVQHMIKCLLGIQTKLGADEADALAIALCHVHARLAITQLGITGRRKRQSWRQFQPY